MKKPLARAQLPRVIDRLVTTTPVYDIHTHLYDPAFGPRSLQVARPGASMSC